MLLLPLAGDLDRDDEELRDEDEPLLLRESLLDRLRPRFSLLSSFLSSFPFSGLSDSLSLSGAGAISGADSSSALASQRRLRFFASCPSLSFSVVLASFFGGDALREGDRPRFFPLERSLEGDLDLDLLPLLEEDVLERRRLLFFSGSGDSDLDFLSVLSLSLSFASPLDELLSLSSSFRFFCSDLLSSLFRRSFFLSLPRLDLEGDLDLLLLEDEEALRDRRRPRFFESGGEVDLDFSFLSPSLIFFSSSLESDGFTESLLSSLRLFLRSFLSLSPLLDLLGGDLDLLLLLDEDDEEELLERRRPFFFLSGEADRDLLLSFAFPSSFLSADFSPLLLSSPRLPWRSFFSLPSLSFPFSFLSLSSTFFSSFPFSSFSSLFRLFFSLLLLSLAELLLRLAPFLSLRSLDRLRLRELKEEDDRLLEPLLLLLLLLGDRRLRPRRRPRLDTEESEEEEEE